MSGERGHAELATRRRERFVHEDIALTPVFAVVTSVIELNDEGRLDQIGFTQHEIDVLGLDAVEV